MTLERRSPTMVLPLAIHNDSDGVFKSRLSTITAPDLAGPFNQPDRARNATRQAGRLPDFDAPTTGPGLTQLYPGIGASTWRVSTDSIDNTNFFFSGGNVDLMPYTSTNNARGTYLIGIGKNGELPYGWGSF